MEDKMTLKEVSGGKEGFKVNYSKLKKVIMHCESNDNKDECRKMLKELDINIYE